MLDRKIFAEGMVRLRTIFHQTGEMSDLYLKDYHHAVEEMTEQQFIRGVQYLIRFHTKPFMPLPAELWQAVKDSVTVTVLTSKEMRIEPTYGNCPPEVKKQIEEIMERLKKKGMK